MADILDNVINTLNTIQGKYNEQHYDNILKEQLINKNKYIWYQNHDRFINDSNYINLLFPLINIENCQECIDSIKYSLDIMLEFYGWEIIGYNVYRIETNSQKWLNDTINFNRITRMFESLNIQHMWKELMLLFLCMCKTASNYPEKIPINIFKKWLSFQYFWLSQDYINKYNSNNKLKKKEDMRWILNNQVIQKGTVEERELFLQRFCKYFLDKDCKEFIEKIESTDPNKRVKYILDYIKE